MEISFAETLKHLRTSKRMTQEELAEKIFVTRSVVAKWENAYNVPDIFMIKRICKVLDIDERDLMSILFAEENELNVIVLDDRKISLRGSIPVISEVLSNANVLGFISPSEAIDFAKKNKVLIAFLDIEMGTTNGLDLSKKFLEINPQTNIIFLTAYVEYSFKAWSTGASGYLLKPITAENLRVQLKNLRYPPPSQFLKAYDKY
jgi:transcriptional regulator with XRE-family HTH domain